MGRAEGRADEEKEIAKKLLDIKMEIETIKSLTGLSNEEIKKLA